jgi:glycosyltransferase involved in cell wall biosynthesis
MAIVYLGKYNESEILTGPEKVAKRIFSEASAKKPGCVFVEYFFKRDRKSNIWLRLFGRENVTSDGSVLRLGIIRLFTFLLMNDPEIIHIITVERIILSIFLYTLLLRGRIIVTVHGIVKHEKAYFKGMETAYSRFKDILLETLIMRNADELVFVSQIELSLAKTYYSIDDTKVRIIPNGIDEAFAASPEKSFEGSSLNVVAYDRGILDSSGMDDLIDILLQAKGLFISLFIIGRSEKREITTERLKVFCVNKMDGDHLRSFLKDKHLYINNGAYESFSMMAVECMAAGIVPVVADTVGMSRFIKDGENGFVYRADQPGAMLEIVKRMGSNMHDLRRLSYNARRIYNELKWEKIASEYEESYSSVARKFPRLPKKPDTGLW